MTDHTVCRADELTDDTHIIRNGQVRHVVKAHTAAGTTAVIYANNEQDRFTAAHSVTVATADVVADYQREQDRHTVCRALTAWGRRIADEQLPVPPGGKGIVLSFDLADDADLKPWAEYLSTRPKRGTSRPHIQAEAEGVEVYVYGPGTSGEFGPELADAPKIDVEHRDSVGAFPVVLSHCARCGDPAELTPEELCKPCAVVASGEREGFAPPSGHAVQAPAEALKYDRFNEGTEA